jgi:hypothetical protein
MKAHVQDPGLLRGLRPLELAAYLRAKGWKQEADLNGKGSLWFLRVPHHTEYDVTLPARRELRDYALRIGELLQTLAEAEGRSQLEILRDVQTTTADLIRVRAPNKDTENGTLPLDKAVDFVGRSRDMMLAAACAVIDKRPVYATRKPQQAMDYLGHVRMGQTERGSYVLTILSPVPPELVPAQGSLLPAEPEPPYERKVVRTLVDALEALDGAARDAAVAGEIAPFQAAVGRGVSANLCDAVAGLAAASAGEGLDIQISWSRTRPIDHNGFSRVVFGSDSIPIIEEAARLFRETSSREDFELEGVVTRLDRGPDAAEGDVTIVGGVDGQMRSITLRFGPETYSLAIKAHQDRRPVRCVGELVKEGRSYRLRDPRHFELIISDEAAE